MNGQSREGGFEKMVGLPAVLAVVVVFWVGLLFYQRKRKFTNTLYFKKSRLNVLLVKKCQTLTKPFTPTFWASGNRLQTFLPWILPQAEVEFTREYLQMADKGIIALDWMTVNDNSLLKVSPVMLLIPALTQTAVDLSSACTMALERKFRPVVFNRRGHSLTPLTTRRLQAFAEGGDLEEAVTFIHRMFPYAEIFAVAYSTGSDLLISYLGEVGSTTNVTAAVCISPSYDTEGYFRGKFFEPYNTIVIRELKMLVRQHSSLWEAINYDNAMKSETVKDFEERVHVRLNPQYYSTDEYWRLNNPMRNVANVSIPVLCVSAIDDPVIPKEIIPFSLFKTSSNFILVAPENGGHCGFLENALPVYWGDRLACDFLETIQDQGVPKGKSDNHLSPLDIQGPRNRSYTT